MKKETKKKTNTSINKSNAAKKKRNSSVKNKKNNNKISSKKVNSIKNNKKNIEVKKDNLKVSNDKKRIEVVFDIIIYILIVIVIICLILLYFKKKKDDETIKEIEQTVISGDIEIIDDRTVEDIIDELKEKYNNDDIKGILSIDGLDVSIPIVKGTDNDYYLKHAVNKKKSVIGTAFIDYRNNVDSKQINIYGHNSTKYNPPFKVLEGYLDEEYYKEHKYFEFMVNNEIRKYEIFSVIIANKSSSEEHMQFNYKKDSNWLKHYKRLSKLSKYKINVSLTEDDNIVVLQTCIFGKYHDKLLVIVGREIERK